MKKILVPLTSLFLIAQSVSAMPVNINQADAAQIADALKGVGLKKAEAIVEYRKQHGQFQSADDLAQVKGIGDKLVSKLRSDILLQNP